MKHIGVVAVCGVAEFTDETEADNFRVEAWAAIHEAAGRIQIRARHAEIID